MAFIGICFYLIQLINVLFYNAVLSSDGQNAEVCEREIKFKKGIPYYDIANGILLDSEIECYFHCNPTPDGIRISLVYNPVSKECFCVDPGISQKEVYRGSSMVVTLPPKTTVTEIPVTILQETSTVPATHTTAPATTQQDTGSTVPRFTIKVTTSRFPPTSAGLTSTVPATTVQETTTDPATTAQETTTTVPTTTVQETTTTVPTTTVQETTTTVPTTTVQETTTTVPTTTIQETTTVPETTLVAFEPTTPSLPWYTEEGNSCTFQRDVPLTSSDTDMDPSLCCSSDNVTPKPTPWPCCKSSSDCFVLPCSGSVKSTCACKLGNGPTDAVCSKTKTKR